MTTGTAQGAEPLRLHLGGREVKAGWKIFNIAPGEGVDFVGDIRDLSRFADGCCEALYASHVLEHVTMPELLPTLRGFRRILRPGGRAMIAVPNLDVLCRLFVHPTLGLEERLDLMRMIYGGQVDAHDFHHVGFTPDILREAVMRAGFASIERVEGFGLFKDDSELLALGQRISLNMIATR